MMPSGIAWSARSRSSTFRRASTRSWPPGLTGWARSKVRVFAPALAGVDQTDARSLLAGLVSKQFLFIANDPLSQARGTYGFVHLQAQRVVLETLSKRERKARHLAAV